jgi:hypothetical protein
MSESTQSSSEEEIYPVRWGNLKEDIQNLLGNYLYDFEVKIFMKFLPESVRNSDFSVQVIEDYQGQDREDRGEFIIDGEKEVKIKRLEIPLNFRSKFMSNPEVYVGEDSALVVKFSYFWNRPEKLLIIK